MQKNYPHLLSPIRIGNVNFRHRMFSAPIAPPAPERRAFMSFAPEVAPLL